MTFHWSVNDKLKERKKKEKRNRNVEMQGRK